ncbi:SDR family oxidoreductase [Sulfuriflexus mobilis]|uniref:SDR family oxidoreductase n=1 Tax=Sulfuriflexus mobilis TaxID=1811807 RepID=UPI000F82E497|nr:SDR family oxidoreductase [Sulfuriflexus mobilis]
MSFNNKHIAITGGAGGIGSLLCQAFAEQGARVTVIDRVENINLGERVSLLQADLSSMDGIQKVCKALADQQVDVLVNLAGLQYFGLFENQSPEQVLLHYMVNLLAPVMLTQAVLPAMKARGNGHIVNIGSTFGSINFAHFVTYSSSKAGMKGFSEALRREVANEGIQVTYVAPRAVKTALNDEKVMQLARATNMNMDSPEYVVGRIMQAISAQKKEAYIGFPECLFVRINALLPRIVDKALAADDRKARTILNQAETA